ncbi:hypothetical protein OAG36_00770 [bacterium]|nr:hypothetical protein [bacterium]
MSKYLLRKKVNMTPTQAAKEIGCTPGTIRTWIRTGTMVAKEVAIQNSLGVDTYFHQYDIRKSEVARLKRLWLSSPRFNKGK